MRMANQVDFAGTGHSENFLDLLCQLLATDLTGVKWRYPGGPDITAVARQIWQNLIPVIQAKIVGPQGNKATHTMTKYNRIFGFGILRANKRCFDLGAV